MKSATFTISRYQGTSGTGISISVTDRPSGILVLEARMTLEDFASLVTGHGYMPATVTRWCGKHAANVGKYRVLKRVEIPHPKSYDIAERMREIRKHPDVKQCIKDGWALHDDGVGTTQQRAAAWVVTFIRFVDEKPEEEKS